MSVTRRAPADVGLGASRLHHIPDAAPCVIFWFVVMKIRAKVVALLAAVFLALTFVEWGVGQILLLPRFEEIEIDNAHTAMKRIDYGVHQTLNELQVSASDWGNWKDTYDYMLRRNPQYERDNLTQSAMKQLRLTALAFIDLNGDFVLSRSLDAVSDEFVPLDLFPQGLLPDDFAWRENLRSGRPGQGLIATDRGVMLAAVTPILDGHGKGPSHGMVLMGRLLTDAEIAEIGARAQTQVALVAVRGTDGHDQSLLRLDGETNSNEKVTVDENATRISRVFLDVYGKPIMALRVEVPRTISKGARTTVSYVLAFTVGAAVIVLLILLVTLDRMVLTPLARVTRHAVNIGAGDDLTTRLNLNRTDEIGVLAVEFDRMVAQVAESRRQHIDDSFHAGMGEISRGVLHNIGNAMTPLSVRLAKLHERLRAAPTGDVEQALAERSMEPDGSTRQADLDEFLRLTSGELAGEINAAVADVDVIARQAAIVQSALAEQSHSSRAPTVIEAAELPAIIEQSLEIVPDGCRERVSIELDPSVRTVGTVYVARTVLRLVLQNLIINASEAIRAAGRDRGKLRFSARLVRDADQHRLELECADTGVGIAGENLERVFEKGYSTKRENGNLGIGLHWCATTITALGGRIWATSDGQDRGATLHLVVPVPTPATKARTRAA
jgi:two-component system NtrC family sensor kinase